MFLTSPRSCNDIAENDSAITCDHQDEQIADLTQALATKFDELSLVYRLSESLEVDDDIASGCIELVDQLHQCSRAEIVIIDLLADEDAGFDGCQIHSTPTAASTAFDKTLIDAIVQTSRQIFDQNGDAANQAESAEHPSANQRLEQNSPSKGCPPSGVRQTPILVASHQVAGIENENNDSRHFMVTQLERRSQILGHFIVVRRGDTEPFGAAESDLLKSTSMLLGVHLMNQRQYLQMQQMFDGMIASLISALDAKDAYTCGHSNRVADLAVELSRRLGGNESQLKQIHMAGMLHDVGKIGVEDSVLRKPGRLTAEEFEQIKQHPVLGFEILSGIRQFRDILPAVRHHHESFDGGGYPDGLAGGDIPREAQILAVADAFDAMTSDRPYRAGMPLSRVVEIFRDGRGKQWSADVVDVLLGSPDVMYQYSLKDQEMVDAQDGWSRVSSSLK